LAAGCPILATHSRWRLAAAEEGAMAAQDLFLKIPGIDGESKDPAHLNEIQVLSYNLSGSYQLSSAAGAAGGSGKVSFADASFSKKIDKAHPNLFKAMFTRQLIPKATLVVRKAGKQQVEYLKYEFEDVYVSHVTAGGAETDVVPNELLTLSFAKLTIEYKEQKADGTLGGSVLVKYDLKLSK
jgi:type VI secretion system secreted protein Hcp